MKQSSFNVSMSCSCFAVVLLGFLFLRGYFTLVVPLVVCLVIAIFYRYNPSRRFVVEGIKSKPRLRWSDTITIGIMVFGLAVRWISPELSFLDNFAVGVHSNQDFEVDLQDERHRTSVFWLHLLAFSLFAPFSHIWANEFRSVQNGGLHATYAVGIMVFIFTLGLVMHLIRGYDDVLGNPSPLDLDNMTSNIIYTSFYLGGLTTGFLLGAAGLSVVLYQK